jgi:hypothetical protein
MKRVEFIKRVTDQLVVGTPPPREVLDQFALTDDHYRLTTISWKESTVRWSLIFSDYDVDIRIFFGPRPCKNPPFIVTKSLTEEDATNVANEFNKIYENPWEFIFSFKSLTEKDPYYQPTLDQTSYFIAHRLEQTSTPAAFMDLIGKIAYANTDHKIPLHRIAMHHARELGIFQKDIKGLQQQIRFNVRVAKEITK